MKCPNCDSEKIQVFSEKKQLPEKEQYSVLIFLKVISIICIVLSSVILLCTFISPANDLTKATVNTICWIAIGSASALLILIRLFQLVQPFKEETKTKAICMDCCTAWYVDEVEIKIKNHDEDSEEMLNNEQNVNAENNAKAEDNKPKK